MGVKLALQEIASFGYCPLQHSLRFRHGLPWFLASFETIVAQVSRDATTHWLLGQQGPAAARGAAERAHLMIDHGHKKALQVAKPQRRGFLNPFKARVEAHLGLDLMGKVFDRKRDQLLGVNVPYTVQVDDIEVTGTIDAIYKYMAESPSPTHIFMMQAHLDDPLDEHVNWGNLKKGFALRTIADGSRYSMSVRFVQFNAFNGELPWKFQAPDPTAKQDFETIIRHAAAGIASGYALPTAHPEKCNHCPYQAVCRPALASPSQSMIETTKEAMLKIAKQSPFWSQS